jgi:hypothetical protein
MSLTKKIYDQLKLKHNTIKKSKENDFDTDEEIDKINKLYENINSSNNLFGGFDNKYKTKCNKYKSKIHKLEELLKNNKNKLLSQ